MINNAFDLWLSSQDISKGSRSTLEIAQALAAAKAGIICLTPNNLTEPWILFEAGGVAKTVDKTLACTLLIGLEPSDVSKPLGEFQHTRLNEKELLQLVQDLNKAAGESARKDTEIDKAFKLCWPELRARLENLPSDGPTKRPQREPEEMLEELIDLARTTNKITESNMRAIFEFQRKSLATRDQIEHLIKVLNVRYPTTWAEVAAGILSSSESSKAVEDKQFLESFLEAMKASASKADRIKQLRDLRGDAPADHPTHDTSDDDSDKK